MEVWGSLLQPSVAGPLLLFAAMLGLFVGLAHWLEGQLSRTPFYQVLFRWVGHPLLRLVPLLLFLSLSADAFFGWVPIGSQTAANELVGERFNSLLNVLFLFSLALPQLPVLKRFHAPLLLIQLMLAFCLLFRWQMQAFGFESYTLLPRTSDGLIIIVCSLAMHVMGQYWSRAIGRWVAFRFHRKQADILAEDMLAVVLQSPSLIIYTHHLGQQAEWLTA